MGILDQPVTLVASPSYPNSIAWSKENLIAIASGHIITIINPETPVRPRGLVKLPPSNPFPISVVKKEDRLTPCIMPLSVARDVRPCARSISWSPPGFAPNSGCLLAVCTTEGRVKVYRSPYSEYSPEWIEVVDISDMLFNYVKRINFRELNDLPVTYSQDQVHSGCISESGCINGLENSVSSKLPENKKTRASSRRIQKNKYVKLLGKKIANGGDSDQFSENSDDDYEESAPKKRKLTTKKAAAKPCSSFKPISSAETFSNQRLDNTKTDAPQLITPKQYASRSALLSSLIVAWSPALRSSGGNHSSVNNKCSILAVGGKSGNISFWRIDEPQCYTIEHGKVSVDPVVVGFLQAHDSWITAVSWGMHTASSSELQLVLATGSCDGSVKIWLGAVEEFITSSETDNAPLSLFREVTTAMSVPVSTISLVVPLSSLDLVLLAIGRGSGSLEACVCHLRSNKLQSTDVYRAHNQVVTGLAWTIDGCHLYSCSQDNSMRSWVLRGSSLSEIPFPSSFPGLKNLPDVSQVTDLCFGLVQSPGELVVAVVCSFDSGLLNQMYQARIQKAAVQFYWAGGQSLANLSDENLCGGTVKCFSLSQEDMVRWKSAILQSLKHYDNGDEPLVLWDSLLALITFQKSAPSFVESILFTWMSSWFMDYQSDSSGKEILYHVQNMLPKMSTRRMHLLNVISRRLMLVDSKFDIHDEKMQDLSELGDGKSDLWKKLLVNSERELQNRLVLLTFKAVLKRAYCSTFTANDRSWCPVGLAQMERWVAINHAIVPDQLNLLGMKVGELRSRIHQTCEYVEEESCGYCFSPVPFESSGSARCKGIKHKDGSTEIHDLKRCAVSMRLGSITSPMWYCMCCERQTVNMPPLSFFTMTDSPSNADYESESFTLQESSKPLCPFCGILLQRCLPDFLLSASPV